MSLSQTKERLRVLHVISGDLWAGAEVQAYTLIKLLSSLCQVSVIVLNTGELEQRLRALGIDVWLIDEQHHSAFSILLKIRKIIQELHPHVIHSHRQKENILSALANVISQRAPSIRSVHGAPENPVSLRSRLLSSLDLFAGNYLQNAAIAVSEELKIKISPRLHRSQIYVIDNGVDVDQLNAEPPADDLVPLPRRSLEVGFVGRLVPVKRVDKIIELAAKVERTDPGKARFHIIGEGPLNQQLKDLCRRNNVDHCVLFHGFRIDTVGCIRSLDAIILCSDHEGLPMTALEALAVGTPLITTLPELARRLDLAEKQAGENDVDFIAQMLNALPLPAPVLKPQFHASACAQKTYQVYGELGQ